MSIHVGYINSSPLSVDTEKDFLKLKLMKKMTKKIAIQGELELIHILQLKVCTKVLKSKLALRLRKHLNKHIKMKIIK